MNREGGKVWIPMKGAQDWADLMVCIICWVAREFLDIGSMKRETMIDFFDWQGIVWSNTWPRSAVL